MTSSFLKRFGLALLFLGFGTVARADLGLSIVGAANYASPSVVNKSSTVLSSNSKLGLGLGALLEFGGLGPVSFELGGIFLQNKYELTTGSVVAEASADTVFFPASLRFAPVDWLSLGGGIYYQSYTDSSWTGNTGDYGLQLGPQFRFSLAPLFCFLIDARLVHGMRDLDPHDKAEFYTRDFLILAGIRIGG